MKILFYSNCQYAGIQHLLELYYKGQDRAVEFNHIINYDSIKYNKDINVEWVSSADVCIYQPIGKHHGVFATDASKKGSILSYLKPSCIKIAFPYIYNSALWGIVPPADIDNFVGEYGSANAYLNKEVIEELVDNGLDLSGILKRYRRGEIDFRYAERFKSSLDVLRRKESECDITVSEFIERKIRCKRLFFTQNHPSSYVFIHCVNQILPLLGENHIFREEDFAEDICDFKRHAWPTSTSDRTFWKFSFNALRSRKSNRFYKKHIKNIYKKYLTTNIYPLGYSIPEEHFIDGEVSKTKTFGALIPGDTSTYIYSKQEEYFKMYKEAMFGFTFRKGGWDCLRHYEIIANQCIPYFMGLEECPELSMSKLPKSEILNCMEEYSNKTLTLEKYHQYANRIFEHAKKHLTCRSSAETFLKTMSDRRRGNDSKEIKDFRVLMIRINQMNYTRIMLAVGLRKVLGKQFVEFPRDSYLYDGGGFTLTGMVDDIGVERTGLKAKIRKHYFDLIVIGNIDAEDEIQFRKIPFWAQIKKYYGMESVAFLFGGDRSPFAGNDFSNGDGNLHQCLAHGVCFVREFGIKGSSHSELCWNGYKEKVQDEYGKKMKDARAISQSSRVIAPLFFEDKI